MADISKIKPNGAEGTEYNLKDAAARSQLGQLGTAAYKSITNSYDATSEDAISGKGVADAVEVDSLSDSTPYLYRQSPAIGTRVMENALVGGSVVVNQLLVSTHKQHSYTAVSDQSAYDITVASGFDIPIIQGHKYLLSAKMTRTISGNNFIGLVLWAQTAASQAMLVWNNDDANGYKQSIFSPYSNQTAFARIAFNNYSGKIGFSAGDTMEYDDFNVIDLTQWLGTTIADAAYTKEQSTAGSGIAWLKDNGFDFSKYIAYNTGTIESVNPSGKKVVGFNQWDEEWDVGMLVEGGTVQPSQSSRRTTSYIPVYDDKTYYSSSGWVLSGRVAYYDVNKTCIYYSGAGLQSRYITPPTGARYMRITINSEYGTTYNHDICINLSKTTGTPKNGDYVPYEEHTYSITQSPLHGLFKLDNDKIVADGDVRKSNGDVTRKYGIVDLSSLIWAYQTYPHGSRFASSSLRNLIKKPTSASEYASGMISSRFYANGDPINDVATTLDKLIAKYVDGDIYIIDKSYSDAATFKTAMSGVYLVYELATPTAEQLTPFDNPQLSYVGGTEEWITTNDVPVGHISEYKALPEWTEDDYVEYLQEQAESVGKIKLVSKLGTYSTSSHTFANLVLASDSIKNVFTYISELVTNVYTAVNDLASALANKANNTDVKGTYDKYTYSTSTHKFGEIAVAEPNKTAIYMAGDINDKLVDAINDHGTVLANVPSKTVLYDDVIEVGDDFSISIPSSFNFILFELSISSSSYYGTGSLMVTSWYNTLNILTTSHESALRTCALMLNQNRVEVYGDFMNEIGELKITAF